MVHVTQAAILRVKDLIATEGNPNLKLRMFVQGGGCAGFSYGFAFDEESADGDIVIVLDGAVTLLVDHMSMQYLEGASVDFREDISGSRFVITNPNAGTSCGCGSSFGV